MSEIVIGAVLLLVYLFLMVVFVQIKSDTSIANFTWGGGVALVAIYTLFMMSSFFLRQILLTAMITMWALRLAIYLYARYRGKGADPRFATWQWQGFKALCINICWIFGQTLLIGIMSYPAMLVNTALIFKEISFLDIFGLFIWLMGFWCEALSDFQLLQFMNNPLNKGRVMRYGLWRYSRHPNYFGEILMWWGVFCIALSVPYGWTTIVAPLTITVMLVFITGIPWIEKTMDHNPEYQNYKQQTSVLIPWFVKE